MAYGSCCTCGCAREECECSDQEVEVQVFRLTTLGIEAEELHDLTRRDHLFDMSNVGPVLP